MIFAVQYVTIYCKWDVEGVFWLCRAYHRELMVHLQFAVDDYMLTMIIFE